MPDISIVGVRLTVEGSEESVAKMAAFDAAAKSTASSLRSVGGDDVHGGLSRLVISLDSAGAGMDRTAGKASGFHGVLKDLDGTLSSVSGSLMRFTAYGLGGAAVGFAGLSVAAATFGVRAASSFQQTQVAFETMLGSVSKGDAFFKTLQNFNYQTPFGLPDITHSAQTLLQYGFTDQTAMPILKTLANVASVAPAGEQSADLARSTLAIGQISSAGVVRGQDINQLTQAGFPIIKLLQQATGMSGPDLERQLQSGGLTLPASSLMDLIASGHGPVLDPYNRAAEAQSKTFGGQSSNFVDKLRSEAAKDSLPLMNSLTAALPQLTDSIDKVFKVAIPPIDAFFTNAAKNLPGFVDRSIPALQHFFDGLERNGPMIGQFFKDLASLIPDLTRVGESLIPIVDGLARGFHDLVNMPGGVAVLDGILLSLVGYKALSGVAGIVRDLGSAFRWLAGGEEAAAVAGNGGGLAGLLGFLKVAGPLAVLLTLAYEEYQGVKFVNSPEGHKQQNIVKQNQIQAHQDGALSGVNAWLKVEEAHSVGRLPWIGKPIRHALGADDAGNFHPTQVHNHAGNTVTIHVHDASDPHKTVKAIDDYFRNATLRQGVPATP